MGGACSSRKQTNLIVSPSHPSPTGHKRAAPSVSFADVSPSYGERPPKGEAFSKRISKNGGSKPPPYQKNIMNNE